MWQSLSAEPSAPNGRLKGLLDNSFGDISGFTQAFKEEAVGHFGSGWAWLCEKGDGLIILTTHDADTPLVQQGVKPLITLDLWEHAYYLDYQNARPNFVDAFLGHLINWDFAALNLVGRPHNLEVENEMLRPPERNGEPPRSATEPPRQREKGQPAKERRSGITKRGDGK